MVNGSETKDGSGSSRDIWSVVNATQSDVAEMKGWLKIHLADASIHHHPPCKQVCDMQQSILAVLGAAVLALLAGIGSLVANVILFILEKQG